MSNPYVVIENILLPGKFEWTFDDQMVLERPQEANICITCHTVAQQDPSESRAYFWYSRFDQISPILTWLCLRDAIEMEIRIEKQIDAAVSEELEKLASQLPCRVRLSDGKTYPRSTTQPPLSEFVGFLSQLRSLGKPAFERKDFRTAASCYRFAIYTMAQWNAYNGEENAQSQVTKEFLKVQTNLIIVQRHHTDPVNGVLLDLASQHTKAIHAISPLYLGESIKYLYQLALWQHEQENPDALETAVRAFRLSPNNASVRKLIESLYEQTSSSKGH